MRCDVMPDSSPDSLSPDASLVPLPPVSFSPAKGEHTSAARCEWQVQHYPDRFLTRRMKQSSNGDALRREVVVNGAGLLRFGNVHRHIPVPQQG